MPIEKVHEFVQPDADTARELVRRAIAAWSGQPGAQLADAQRTAIRLDKGLGYVVVRAPDGGVLAVYRIRPDNLALRRMKRWPAGIER